MSADASWRDQALFNTSAQYHNEWQHLGSPRVQDFTMTFVPVGEMRGHPIVDGQWVVEGRYYARIFALAEPEMPS